VWSSVGAIPFERGHQKYCKKVVDKKMKGWEEVHSNRWCRLCDTSDGKKNKAVDLLDLSLGGGKGDTVVVFYAHGDKLGGGGACCDCFAKLQMGKGKSGRNRRKPERHRDRNAN